MKIDELRLVTRGKIVPCPAVFEDWPLGRGRRGRMSFVLEDFPGRGQRIIRHSDGAKGHKTTYAYRWWVVNCTDGKTRLVRYTKEFGESFTIYDHTGKIEAFGNSTVFSSDEVQFLALMSFTAAFELRRGGA